MAWDEDTVGRLRKLWDEGLPCSLIGEALGFTRNAVIGKAHRLQLPDRASGSARRIGGRMTGRKNRMKAYKRLGLEQKMANAAARAAKVAEFTAAKLAPDLVVPIEKRKGLIALEDKDCRWPIGDPQTPEFHFCDQQKVPGLPYCEFHRKRAFEVPSERQRHTGELGFMRFLPGSFDKTKEIDEFAQLNAAG